MAALAALSEARPTEVTATALQKSKRQLLELFLIEIELRDPTRAAKLQRPLTALGKGER